MGLLDEIRDRLQGRQYDDYYEDDMYEDEYDDEEAAEEPVRRHRFEEERVSGGTGLLGNTSRPEAESVSVFTRSGRPLNEANSTHMQGARSTYDYAAGTSQTANLHGAADVSGPLTPGRPVSRPASVQLPAYVLRPALYDDVQMVIRRVRTRQPVVLVFKNTPIETAKRILDFSFGLACGLGGNVEELGDRVFAVLPAGVSLTAADLEKLESDGDLVR